MNRTPFLTSLTRPIDLAAPLTVEDVPRADWSTGALVFVRVVDPVSPRYRIELRTGRMIDVVAGDAIVGVLGDRAATLEATGSWSDMSDDGLGHLLTGAGLIGKCRSRSVLLPPLIRVRYVGHLARSGRRLRLGSVVSDEALASVDHTVRPGKPCILLIGSSMSAGKTSTARIIVRLLKGEGYRVLGVKMTGAGRYRDILSMQDAGADEILDFVDVGLPSTIGPDEEITPRLRALVALMADSPTDVAVIEAGASPMEPYHGDTAVRMIESDLAMTVLCASDPYAVLGIITAFGLRPDLVTGIATNTNAGVALIRRLSNLPGLNVLDRATWPELKRLVAARLGGHGPSRSRPFLVAPSDAAPAPTP